MFQLFWFSFILPYVSHFLVFSLMTTISSALCVFVWYVKFYARQNMPTHTFPSFSQCKLQNCSTFLALLRPRVVVTSAQICDSLPPPDFTHQNMWSTTRFLLQLVPSSSMVFPLLFTNFVVSAAVLVNRISQVTPRQAIASSQIDEESSEY